MITCDDCGGECCKILVVEIETPETKDDFEDIKWYLYHPGICVYIDTDNAWNVQFDTKCRYLGEDDKCTNYDKRPPVCRYALTENCHKNVKEIKKFFNNLEEYEFWLDNYKKNK